MDGKKLRKEIDRRMAELDSDAEVLAQARLALDALYDDESESSDPMQQLADHLAAQSLALEAIFEYLRRKHSESQ